MSEWKETNAKATEVGILTGGHSLQVVVHICHRSQKKKRHYLWVLNAQYLIPIILNRQVQLYWLVQCVRGNLKVLLNGLSKEVTGTA